MINRLKDWRSRSRSSRSIEGYRTDPATAKQRGQIAALWEMHKPSEFAELGDVLYEKYGKKYPSQLTQSQADSFILEYKQDSSD